jgi:hypothetical protein
VSNAADATPPESRRPAKRYVSVAPTIVLLVVFLAASLLLLGALMSFWPGPATDSASPEKSYTYLGFTLTLSREESFLLVVAIAGAIGAMGHVLRSFYRYVGERKLVWSWVASYVLIPVVGAVLATIIYIVIRAGLIPGGGAAANEFGFVALALLSGMFSSQAAEKLKQVFETFFTPTPAGPDSLEPTLGITGFEPPSGKAGDPVKLRGVGLEDVDDVQFAGGLSNIAEYDEDTKTLTTTIPEGAITGRLTVRVDSTEAHSSEQLVVADEPPTTGGS